MKLGIIYTSPFPPKNGASGADRRVRDITRGLCFKHNIVYLLIPIWHNTNICNTDSADFEIKYLGNKAVGSNIFGRILFWIAVVKFAIIHNLIAIIIYSPIPDSIFAILALRAKGIKVFLEICDLMSAPSRDKTFARKLKRYYSMFGELIVPKLVNGVITISSYLNELIIKNTPNKPILILPILVDSNNFKPKETSKYKFRTEKNYLETDIIITYVGGLWKNEGVDYLLNAFLEIIEETKLDNVYLAIAGKIEQNSEMTDVHQILKNKIHSNKINLLGQISTNKVIDLLDSSDILVVPQIENDFNKAGLPTKLAEYSAMKKAIVATNVGDVPKYFINNFNAKIVEPSNIDSLKIALSELIIDSPLRKKLGENAFKTALSIFDYKLNGEKLYSFINKNLEK